MIDKRSQVGVALRRIQEELTVQVGGPDAVTPARALLIEQVAVKAVIVKAVGEYVLRQEPSELRRPRAPVVLQHDTMQNTLAELLEKIGLERRAKPMADIRRQLGMD
jgi:hypothetical protein